MSQSNLTELAAFVALARRQSFRLASVDLSVSPSAVSHSIRALEDRLSLRLFNRTTRSVALTDAGRHFYERLGPAFEGIESAVEDLNVFRNAPYGTLRINAPRPASRLVLMPLIADFLRSNAQMKVEVTHDDALSDIVREGQDAGVRFGEFVAENMIATPLGPQLSFAVVGTPRYFETKRPPKHPSELKEHECVCYRFPGGRPYNWEFQRGSKYLEVAVNGHVVVDDMDAVLEAVLLDIGLGYVFAKQAEQLLERGQLIQVLEPWCPPMPGFFLYYPSRKHLSFGLRAFIDFVRKRNR